MARPAAPRYRTTNWRSYNVALRRRGSLEVWFDPQMAWFATPTVKRGRQLVFSDTSIQTGLMLKALFGLPLRQTTGLVASLIKVAGLGWPTPDFSTFCRRQKSLDVAIACRPAKGALRLLVDSAGIRSPASANGVRAGMDHRSHGNGARSISASTPTRWRSGPSR